MAHRRIENRGPGYEQEYKAGESGIYPGMLVDLNAAGELIKHATSEVQTPVILAMEDALQGNTVATVYLDNNRVPVLIPSKGAVVNALVESGQNVTIGDVFVSGGNGLFIETESATSGVLNAGALVKAIETIAAQLTANTLVACRVI